MKKKAKTSKNDSNNERKKFFVAIAQDDNLSLKAILSSGANVNCVDRDGRTPLHDASIMNKLEAAELLLQAKADVNAKDAGKWTALHFAAQNWLPDLAKLLVAHGAAVDSLDEHGNTPLSNAVFNSRGRGELIEILLKAGADKNLKNNHDVSPLDLAKTIANYKIPLS